VQAAGLCGEPAGRAALTAAAADPRGPETYQPDAEAFQTLLARMGSPVEMARYSTSFQHAIPSQAANIALVARRLTGLVVPAGGSFSYNRAVGPYTEGNGFGMGRMFVGDRIVPSIGGGVCQGASTLYNVVLLANLPVLERHRHSLVVPYLPPGRDATVSWDADLDFRFRNNTGGPLVLWGEALDRRLTLAIYGRKAPPPVEIHTKLLATYPFRTLYRDDPRLPAGRTMVVAPGQDGARAETWVTVETPDGPVRHDLGIDTYLPSPRIVRRGTRPADGTTGSGRRHAAGGKEPAGGRGRAASG
jgi:vancomycin resistance protein VanW